MMRYFVVFFSLGVLVMGAFASGVVLADEVPSYVPGSEVVVPVEDDGGDDAGGGSGGDVARFSDIAESEYRASIEKLAERGIVNGYEGGVFRPEQTVNRAEFLTVVFQALGIEAGDVAGGCFDDVAEEWFASFVCRAKELGVVVGYGDGSYKPGQAVNMAEAEKIAMEAFEVAVGEMAEGVEWFQRYLDFAHEQNVFSKYTYFAGREMRRDEVARLVDKLLRLEEGEEDLQTRAPGSEGCGLPEPGIPPTKFTVRGAERETITIIPDSYDENVPLPLIVAFHGRTGTNREVRSYYRLERDHGGDAIFVYPQGLPNGDGYNWADSGDASGELRDYEFFDEIVGEIGSKYCVDEDQIYAVGHSLGAWFVNSLACARGDVLRAVGTIGGSRSQSNCTGPVAAMQWHNPNDRLAPFSGAEVTRDLYVAQNQCSLTDSRPISPAAGSCVEYQGCYDGAPVIFCPHTNDYDSNGNYYPHNWPRWLGEEFWVFFEGLDK